MGVREEKRRARMEGIIETITNDNRAHYPPDPMGGKESSGAQRTAGSEDTPL